MGVQWLKVTGFFSVFIGIILISVVLGGYSSLYRSESRIADSKGQLLKACQARMNIVPKLFDALREKEYEEILQDLIRKGEIADEVLKYAVSQTSPMDKTLTVKIEMSQTVLTKELIKVFLLIDQFENKTDKDALATIKQEFYSAQDKLFVAKARYNMEVNYFNTRTKIFPGFIIAKRFGFNKSQYFIFSEDSLLNSKNIFQNKE